MLLDSSKFITDRKNVYLKIIIRNRKIHLNQFYSIDEIVRATFLRMFLLPPAFLGFCC